MGRLYLSALLVIAGCRVSGGAPPPDAKSALRPTDSARTPASAAPATPAATKAPADWREAARLLDWTTALRLIAMLGDEKLSTPKMRLARGVIALHAGSHAEAVKALDGLELEIPLLRAEIGSWYAQAAAVAGPYEVAAERLLQSPKARHAIQAAEALLRAKNFKKARAVIDKTIKRTQRTKRKGDETAARWTRARIAESAKNAALAIGDWKWIVTHQPGSENARAALAKLDEAKHSVAIHVRLQLLSKSVTPATLDATLSLLDAIANKQPAHRAIVVFARAKSMYQARAWRRATAAFDKAAPLAGGRAAEAMYYAARAFARSSREIVAITRYQAIQRRFRSTLWVERAAFRQAELYLQLGQDQKAANAFARYLSRYRKGPSVDRARYNHALAMLGSGKHRKAQKLLRALRKDARSRRVKASLQQLEGVAAARAGDTARAAKLWRHLIKKQPLTWPALAAHARLKAMGETPPPLIRRAKQTAFSPLPIELPKAPELLRSLGLDLAAERKLATMEDGAGKRYPGRESEALCEMYGKLSGARRRHQVGSRAASLALLMRPPKPSERWAWHCVYPHPYHQVVQLRERDQKVPAGLVHAVMRQESAFRTNAVSRVGARGLMQLMPYTAARVLEELKLAAPAEQITRPDLNIRVGAFYVGKVMRIFHGSIPLAVAAYNAGPHAVDSWLRHTHEREADVFVARIPYQETRRYVARVMTNFARYQYLAGGVDKVTRLTLALPAKSRVTDADY